MNQYCARTNFIYLVGISGNSGGGGRKQKRKELYSNTEPEVWRDNLSTLNLFLFQETQHKTSFNGL